MRKRKTIKIDDAEYTVVELTVRQVWNLINGEESGRDLGNLDALLTAACPDLTREKAMDMAPSELDQIWQAAREVNSVFLELASKAGLEDGLMDAVRSNVATSIAQSVAASVPVTEQ